MKKLIYILFISALSHVNTLAQSECPNGGGEFANFSNWEGRLGAYTQTPNEMNIVDESNFGDRISLVDNDEGGVDDYGGFSLVQEGNYSIKLGDNSAVYTLTGNANLPAHSEVIAYTFTVTDPVFEFSYALVLQDMDHEPHEQPKFSYWMVEGTDRVMPTVQEETELFVGGDFTAIARQSDPFFKVSDKRRGNAPVLYRDWTCAHVDINPSMIGKEATIYFRVWDCVEKGHMGYAYIDGLCEDFKSYPDFDLPENICEDDPIILDASSTTNEDSYGIEVTEVDENNQNIPGTVQAKEIFPGEKAGSIDLRNWYETNSGSQLECNKRYKVTLTTSFGECDESELTKFFQINCSEGTAPDDIYTCCDDNIVQLEVQDAKEGENYNWFKLNREVGIGAISVNMEHIGEGASISFDTKDTDHLIALQSEKAGCVSNSWLDVIKNTDFSLEITRTFPGLSQGDGNCLENISYSIPDQCDGILTADVSFMDCSNEFSGDEARNEKRESQLTYEWSTRETTKSIAIQEGETSYWVKVTDNLQCKSNSARFIDNMNGYYSQELGSLPLNASSGCNPNVPSQYFKITDTNVRTENDPNFPAYNAYRYRLRIYNRLGAGLPSVEYGELVYCREVSAPIEGFTNGEIIWDGRDMNGNLVPMDTYIYELTLWNCQTVAAGETEFVYNTVYKYSDECKKWKYTFGDVVGTIFNFTPFGWISPTRFEVNRTCVETEGLKIETRKDTHGMVSVVY